MTDPPDEILDRYGLSAPVPLGASPIAWVWAVRGADGRALALKLYARADRGNEAAGGRYLSAMRRRGAVEILQDAGRVVLMERLIGPSLGDIARDGAPERADRLLAGVAANLHRPPLPRIAGLTPLRDSFRALFDLGAGPDCPAGLRRDVARAQSLAMEMLDAQTDPRPLHGDLHHDNVILTADGTRVFDAKGYLGDRAYELANALRHPRGVTHPTSLTERAECFAPATGIPAATLLRWAAVKCAQSIAWRAQGQLSQDRDSALLARLLGLADQ